MIIIEILQYGLATVVGLLLGYQLLLSLFAIKAKKIQNFHTSQNRKFAIVLPAHNEERVIAKTLYSLHGLVYPKNMYDLIVVADNCRDETARIARNLGAIVLELNNEKVSGKGYALQWAFDQMLEWNKNYEAIIVFDSDSLVSGNYLEVMNYYMDQGSEVIQSSNLVLSQSGVWSSEIARIRFLLYNFVRPMGRKVLGFNIRLDGNGMCISTEVLKRIPWQASSMAEDVEYGLNLILNDVSIDFAPEASVWTQMPIRPESLRERTKGRWYPLIREYAPKLLSDGFKRRSFKHLDTFIDLITPPLVDTLLFVLIVCGLNAGMWALGWFPVTFLWLWLGIVGLGMLHLFVGLFAAGADKTLYKSLIYIPVYAFVKIKFYAKSFLTKNEKQWTSTPRKTPPLVEKTGETK
jgi:cellulose synthase/poly-beta-1,6-N-acetylglucosamine synthase-like glycosyltransferase